MSKAMLFQQYGFQLWKNDHGISSRPSFIIIKPDGTQEKFSTFCNPENERQARQRIKELVIEIELRHSLL